jgi:hypothetical protein
MYIAKHASTLTYRKALHTGCLPEEVGINQKWISNNK